MGQGETSANRAYALEQEVINLRAQYGTDVATLQRVVNGHAESQESVIEELLAQMTIIMQKLAASNQLLPLLPQLHCQRKFL